MTLAKICVMGNGYEAKQMVEIISDKDLFKVKLIESPNLEITDYNYYIACCPLNDNNVDIINKICLNNQSLLIVERKVNHVGMIESLFPELNVSYSPSRFDRGRVSPSVNKIPKLLGGINQQVEEEALLFYKNFFENIVGTGGIKVAEASKIFEDYHRMVNISFANEYSKYCIKNKIDPYVVMDLAYTKPYGMDGPYYPWVGVDSIPPMIQDKEEAQFSIISTALYKLSLRTRDVFEEIVVFFCNGIHDKLHEMRLLVVGIGYKQFSDVYENSPIIEIINLLRLEGSKVDIYDLYVKLYNTEPELYYNSGKPKYDGIIVFHPYLLSKWSKEKKVLYYCIH